MPSLPNKKTVEEIAQLFQPQDSLAVPLATGQPMALLNALGNRTDWQELKIFCGLLTFPYPLLNQPNIFVTSGYYGPIERYLNEAGANVEYLPANFRGFETYALKRPSRVVATVLSPPDEEGYLSFGSHGAAVYKPFVQACQNPNQLAIAEINHRMPIVYGDPNHGDNKIHIGQVDYYYEVDSPQISVEQFEISDAEKEIATQVVDLIEDQATLQFGIGPLPNLVAELLADGKKSNFGIHSELFSDGLWQLILAGKVNNLKKGCFQGQSIFTFALGSQKLYDWLDERKGQNNRSAICLPVSVVNDPYYIAKNHNFVSVNSGLMIDFAGQVSSEAIGLRQYSGVGGQLSFVQGAYESLEGKSILCIKSTATVKDKKVSNIMATLPKGSLISTPRHFVQYVVTEYGIADLYGVSDEKRAEKLIAIAHPDFREELKEKFQKIQKLYYKN